MVVGRGDFNKRGQVTIFIIVAILIVAFGILIYMFYPKIGSDGPVDTESPSAFIQECLEEKIQDTVETISLQGGSFDPSFYYSYGEDNIEYLCYTNQYYRPCVVQQPFLAKHIQSEIENEIEGDVEACFNSMEKSYTNKGYTTDLKRGDFSVELLPNKIITSFSHELVLTKGDVEKYQNFKIVLDNNLYELASIAGSIVGWETLYGDVEVTSYMNYYHNLKIEKQKQSDETTVYILTDRDSEKKFQFASRSYAFPPGYF